MLWCIWTRARASVHAQPAHPEAPFLLPTTPSCNRPQLWGSSLQGAPNPCKSPSFVQTHLDKAPYTAMAINSVEVRGKGLPGGWPGCNRARSLPTLMCSPTLLSCQWQG